jgi:hypothetical protein
MGVSRPSSPAFSASLRAVVLGGALLGALLLVVAEFTTLFTVRTAVSATPVKSVSTGSHNTYAMIPIALMAVALAWGAILTGSRWALVAIAGLGVVALLIALIGDLPDAQATGTVGSLVAGFHQATDKPSAGMYLETLGAIVLLIAGGCGLLLGAPGLRGAGAPGGRTPPN